CAVGNNREATLGAAFPGCAVAFIVELPFALTPRAAFAGRDALRLAIGRECHLEFHARRACGSERLTVEKYRLNFGRHKSGNGGNHRSDKRQSTSRESYDHRAVHAHRSTSKRKIMKRRFTGSPRRPWPEAFPGWCR